MLEKAGAPRLMHSWMTSAAAKGPRASGWQTISSGMEQSSRPDAGALADADAAFVGAVNTGRHRRVPEGAGHAERVAAPSAVGQLASEHG